MKHIRMTRAMAEKWLRDLRSGEYKQGHHFLQDRNGGYCCLGVLQMGISGYIEGDGIPLALPTIDWLNKQGIEFLTGEGEPASVPYCTLEANHFSHLNDTGHSFQEIANLLQDEIEYTD